MIRALKKRILQVFSHDAHDVATVEIYNQGGE